MDLVTVLIAGTVLHQFRANSKYKNAKEISKEAVARVAEAEMKYEEYQKETRIAYECLCTRIAGMTDYLTGSFASMLKPFESEDGSYMEVAFGEKDLQNLRFIKRVEEKRSFRQLPAHRKQSGTEAVITRLLFGTVGEANRHLDTAKTQRSVSYLVAEHADTLCTLLDMQKERYNRVYQLLGALNIALITTSKAGSQAIERINWLLDESGHIPAETTSAELKMYLTEDGLSQITNSINIARVIMCILEDPLFDENAEITEKAEKAIETGEQALQQIQKIQQNGR